MPLPGKDASIDTTLAATFHIPFGTWTSSTTSFRNNARTDALWLCDNGIIAPQLVEGGIGSTWQDQQRPAMYYDIRYPNRC